MTDESTPPTRRFAPPPRITVLVAVAVIVLDQVTKHWAVTHLSGAPPRHVIWTLQWNLTFNSGMAFSSAKDLGPLIGVLAIGVAVWLSISIARVHDTIASVAAGFVIGGALGNVIDRVFRGRGWMRGSVVDFIDFRWFPIFNIADMAVNVGGVLFLLWSLFGHPAAARA